MVNASAGRRTRRDASQVGRTEIQIRELILSGRIRAGARASELALVEELGVSRTPVRIALARLEAEGLLEVIPSGGYAVKAFSEREVLEAIEIRGTMEGLAVRLAAERGASPDELVPVDRFLGDIDEIIARGTLTAEDFADYVEANAQFHHHLVRLAGSDLIARQVDRAHALPFASPRAIVLPDNPDPGSPVVIALAQDQHRRVVEAIVAREGARAEAIMREHARISSRNLSLVVRSHPVLGHISRPDPIHPLKPV